MIPLAIEPAVGFDLHSFGILLHILLLTYWLGADLGVFYSSRFVINPQISPDGRATALKIMHFVDLAPRIALILMLPSGITLMAATELGRDIFYGWPLALAWVGCLLWLVAMIVSYFRTPAKHADLAHRVDTVVRGFVAAGLFLAAGYAFAVDSPFGVHTNPKWLAGKVAAYAICILGGIMIRVALKSFGPAFGALMSTGSSPEVEAALQGAMRRAMPWVVTIWIMILTAAALGVFKPGTTA